MSLSININPQDIINLLIIFTKSSNVYATTNKLGTGHPEYAGLEYINGWNQVRFLMINIS